MKNYNDIYDMKQEMCDMVHTAYSKGYDKGVVDTKFAFDEKAINEAYQKGLADAWECAKLLALPSQDGGMDYESIRSIFGNGASWEKAFMNYSASEAIAKIKEHEEKKKADEEIKVGDEVVGKCGAPAIVTRVTLNHITIIFSDGSSGPHLKKDFKKTGRHFDIQSLLDQMNDEQ